MSAELSRRGPTLLKSSSKPHLIPLPLAAGGVGLLLALASPGGLSGGEGFLLGFVVGIAIVVLEAWGRTKAKRTENTTTVNAKILHY